MINLNNQNIKNILLGSAPIKKVLINEVQVYPTEEPGYENEYLTFTALEDNCDIYYRQKYDLPVEYSTDKTTWTTSSYSSNFLMATLNTGDHLYIRGNNDHYATSWPDSTANRFYGSKRHDISGNLMSLTYGDNFDAHSEFASNNAYLYCQLFENDTYLVHAENLKLTPTILKESCYQEMFCNCTSLVSLPELNATTAATGCYWGMFNGCTSLPSDYHYNLPATTLNEGCYSELFRGSRITDARNIIISADTIPSAGNGCLRYMFQNASLLQYSPKLTASTIGRNGYDHLFYNCSSLNYIECLATTIDSSACNSWTSGVASSGTFVKHVNATWTTGINGIPSGWDIIEVDPEDDTWFNYSAGDPDNSSCVDGTYYDDIDAAAQEIGCEDAAEAYTGADLYTMTFNDKEYYHFEPHPEEEPEEEPEE